MGDLTVKMVDIPELGQAGKPNRARDWDKIGRQLASLEKGKALSIKATHRDLEKYRLHRNMRDALLRRGWRVRIRTRRGAEGPCLVLHDPRRCRVPKKKLDPIEIDVEMGKEPEKQLRKACDLLIRELKSQTSEWKGLDARLRLTS